MNMNPLHFSWAVVVVFYSLCFLAGLYGKRRFVIANVCGHQTTRKGQIEFFGKKIHIKAMGKRIDYCIDCTKTMTIRCAWCGGPIFPGNSITLYSPMSKNQKMRPYAILYEKENNSFIGCTGCSMEAHLDSQGIWDGKKVIKESLQ